MPKTDNDQARTSVSGSRNGSSNPKEAVQSAVDDIKGAVDEASGAVGDVAASARETVAHLASEAQSIASEAGDKAKSIVEENKGRAAQQISGLTSAIAKAADELESQGQGQFAKYARDLSGSLDGFGRSLNEKGVDELMGSVAQFAKSQPAAFLGAAALLGFASSRFALSTAKPQPTSQPNGLSPSREGQSQGDASYLSASSGLGNGSRAYPGGH